ncbi:MAG TPA: hypothetical protein VHU23_18035 [Rhizomicrobium sp.]|jgi:hypothetical protein|nr:hypothetical protein [Rhizomicrobium sp.]
MKTLVSISIAAAGLWVSPAIPAEPNDIMICQDVRDKLIILGAGLLDPHVRPLGLLSKGSQHIIELATATDEASVSDDVGFQDYLTALKRKFHPDSKLDDSMREALSSGYDEIDSLPNDPVRAATNSSGSATCTTFLFFQVQPNGASRLLPDPPQSMDGSMSSDIGPRRIECYVSDGHLARIKGQTVFLVADYDPTAFESDVRISTFESGRLTGGCGVDISFTIDYKLAALSVADTSAVTREDLVKYSSQIARALDASSGPYDLTYGDIRRQSSSTRQCRLFLIFGPAKFI